MVNKAVKKNNKRLERVIKSIRNGKANKIQRDVRLKKDESPFYLSGMATANCGNELLKNGVLNAMVPDNQWPGEGMSKLKTQSKYRVLNFYVQTNKTGKKSELIVSLEMVDTENDLFQSEVGNNFDISASVLLVSMMYYSCHLSPTEQVAHFSRILKPSSYPTAEERSVVFSKMVKTASDAEPDKAQLVVTLDGPMRNTWALLNAGVCGKNIVVMEMRPITALYHRLMKMGMRWDIHTIWTGQDQRRASKGFQTYFYNHKLLARHGINASDIGFFYADFCGDIPRNIRPCIARLPNLRVLGITQGKRKCRDDKLIDIVSASWAEKRKSKLKLIATYDQRSVRCSFFELGL